MLSARRAIRAGACAAASLLVAGCGMDARFSAGEFRDPSPWTVQQVSRDQRTLLLRYHSGGCRHAARADVRESADAVAIQVTERDWTGPDVVCTADIRYPRLRVRLSAPLDGR